MCWSNSLRKRSRRQKYVKDNVCYSPCSDQNANFQISKASKPITLVLMWIDIDEIRDKVRSNSCVTL